MQAELTRKPQERIRNTLRRGRCNNTSICPTFLLQHPPSECTQSLGALRTGNDWFPVFGRNRKTNIMFAYSFRHLPLVWSIDQSGITFLEVLVPGVLTHKEMRLHLKPCDMEETEAKADYTRHNEEVKAQVGADDVSRLHLHHGHVHGGLRCLS